MKAIMLVLLIVSIPAMAAGPDFDENLNEVGYSAEAADFDSEFSTGWADNSGDDANLTCTCRGGPGNYEYRCAPIRKTCHGGPGNYPYTCYVCP